MKRICIIIGSPRKNGNTCQLLKPFLKTLLERGSYCKIMWLYDLHIQPCVACRACQKDWKTFGCQQDDDVRAIFKEIMKCDILVLATPIYSWYCTPPMKALLDRLVYGMNKYYGEKKGPSLWAGKAVALVTTCGYPPEKGADLWEEGMKRYCKHSKLNYLGMLAERHMGYDTVFMDAQKEKRAISFADYILKLSCFQ